MTTPLEAGAVGPIHVRAPDTSVSLPQSDGPDGAERLRVAWERPRRFWFFTEVNNTWVGLLYIARGRGNAAGARRRER